MDGRDQEIASLSQPVDGGGVVLCFLADRADIDSIQSEVSRHGMRAISVDNRREVDQALAVYDVLAIVIAEEFAALELVLGEWGVPVVVLLNDNASLPRQARDLALGASHFLTPSEIGRLPGMLSDRQVHHERRESPRTNTARIAADLLSEVHDRECFDRYCAAATELLGAEEAALVISCAGGELRTFAQSASAERERDLRQAKWRTETDGRSLTRLEPRASLDCERIALPLSLDGDRIGFLVSSRAAAPFSPSETADAEVLADLASAALRCSAGIDAARRSDGEKSEFLRSVSHELRTPLDTVIGYVDILLEGAFGPLPEEHRKVLRRVVDRARGLVEVLAATLDLSGVDRGHEGLEMRQLSVAAMMRELERDLSEWSRRRELECVWEVAEGLPSITTDGGKLRVILRNLVTNAVKFTDKGRIVVRAVARSDGVEISVKDSGIGMDKEALTYVFEAFRQGGPAPERGGLGLGLFIVRRLVAMLGGMLSVESKVNVGSKFVVWIPRERSSAQENSEL